MNIQIKIEKSGDSRSEVRQDILVIVLDNSLIPRDIHQRFLEICTYRQMGTLMDYYYFEFDNPYLIDAIETATRYLKNWLNGNV